MHAATPPFRRPDTPGNHRYAGDLCLDCPTIEASGSNAAVMDLFSAYRDLSSLAVVEDDRPIGLINRNIFLSQMSKPFYRELYDRKSCIAFMDKEPLVVEAGMTIEALTFKTVESGGKALTDGFIITREGRFAGLGNGLQLMSAVADMQAEKNRQTMQSIEYASVIQRAMLRASREALATALGDAALAWEPRDVVGGDFYHFAAHDDGWFGALADCTGHGVPGAFMTLLASSALSKALEQLGPRDPAALLSAVNRSLKALLSQDRRADETPESDDGLDAAFFWFDAKRGELRFAGARIATYILRPGAEQFDVLAGQRMGVGYVDSDAGYAWAQQTAELPSGSLLFITTDGCTDQIGGPRKIAFGKRRACEAILAHRDEPAGAICDALKAALAQWQGAQNRRDDVTLFCARIQEHQ
jgi:serine phosphatase RsbU (regulator of sigma subunit)